ncbi:VirB4-like conjugal transfer ATPase, CD1110 family, partial [Gemmiger formicilis]|uniref:VirB4-like conjugal transfer ATPase, CD1110 family n=1 Tax=Gemmiger formicilis TaxID=745368 RepID=UPI00242E2881
MRLSEYASTQRTYGSRKVPRSVQQSIPIDRIYEDGTWCCGNVYSQMWSMPDINFTMSDEDNKAKILNLLGKVYMGVPSDCWLKICIVSQRMDEKSFRENVLLHRNLDGLDKWRVERNRRIRQCVQDAGNVVQHKYLILSTNKQNVTDARSRLRQVQGNLLAELSNLGCTIKPMTNNERLEVLHNFFRRGEEGRFQFSFDDYGKLGNDFRNTIAPDAMRFTTQHAEIDDGFAKAMTIAQYPQQLSDNFVATLLQQVPYIVLSIDITPVETEDAMREIEASQMKIDSEKYRANRRNVENLDFMATISPRNQQQEKYTAEIRNAICEGDQQIFMVLLSVAFFADTPDELRQETDALQSAAANFNCRFTEMRFQQENCFNTAMPYGLRRVESSHMMLTRSVTALVPFVAQEVQSPQGIFYGRNAITGNLIVGDRTKLINGNAMVIATSGSGKSMSVKMEIIMEFLRWPNARFILVDPENEYELLVKALGGEAIKVSVDSRTHFNPLDYHYDPKTDVPPDVAKIEFVLSMLDKLIGENGHLQPEDRSLIAASLKNIYKPLIASGYTAPCPTLGDLYRDLNKSNLRRAKQLALMLDVFANGSLQAFSHTTNVDMNNRLICFNIQSLGDQLRPIAMMSLLEFINMQVMTNRRKDATAATWIYFDEIHVLLKDPMSSNFLYSSWKRFRKYNA